MQDSFERDTTEMKIDLSLAGFREESGKIFIPPTVRHVEKTLRNERILLLDPLPIQGLDSFLDVGTRLAYGQDSPAYRKERVSAIPDTFTRKGSVVNHVRYVPSSLTLSLVLYDSLPLSSRGSRLRVTVDQSTFPVQHHPRTSWR